MKMIKTTREVPFLLTVAALFVVAIVHLGLQIWGSPAHRTPADALEAPVKAPKISSPTIDPEPAPPETTPPATESPEEPAAEPESQPVPDAEPEPSQPAPESGDPVPAANPEPAPAPETSPEPKAELKTPKTEPKPVAKPAEAAKPAAVKKPAPKTEKVVAKPADPSEVKVVKAEPLKPAKKGSRKKKKADVEPQASDYTVPAEWNWFSKPLTMKHNGSEWVLAAEDGEAGEPLQEAKQEPAASDVAAMADVPASDEPEQVEQAASVTEPVAVPAPISNTTQESAVIAPEKARSTIVSEGVVALPPFERALAKMASRKAKRLAEAERLSVALPSSGGTNEKVPASLVKMIDTLGKLSGSSPETVPTGGISSGETTSATDPVSADAGARQTPNGEKPSTEEGGGSGR